MKQLITLPQSATITIPTYEPNSPATIEATINEMVQRFGGATVTQANGHWYSDEQEKVISEPVTIITSYCKGQMELSEVTIKSVMCHLAFKVKKELEQEAVAITVNGTMFLL